MLLRTRISLFVTIAFAVVCVSILLATTKREELAQIEYAKATIFDQQNLWEKVKVGLIQQMADGVPIARDNQAFVDAMQDNDNEAIRFHATRIADQIAGEGIASRFDVIRTDGTLAYSSHPAVFQSSVIQEGVAIDVATSASEVSGVGNDKARNTVLVYGFPLRTALGESAGLAIYAIDIVDAIKEMEELTQASVSVVNRRGRMLAASDPSHWEQYGEFIRLNEIGELQRFDFEDRFYSAVVLPESSELGGLIGRLVIIKDVTGLALQQQRISQITIVSIAAFVLIMLVGLNVYMSRAFSPLDRSVKVLNALSEGDLDVQMEGEFRKDEIGTIVDAVNRFRSSLLTLVRLRRSRERQRSRQEKFIQREMTHLANTLDGEARETVISELDQLGGIIQQSSNDANSMSGFAEAEIDPGVRRDSDSLALMANAFQSMSNRVQDQHEKLRAAIATREALIALRQELDIATRVQLSLLPDPIELHESVDVGGSMFAAKEVGGDFFDYFRLDERHIGIAVADVSGKGVAAALFMAMARTLLRGTVGHVRSPAKVLENMNNFLEENNNEQLFLTMLYGVLDEQTGKFNYASAGHDPPIIRSGEEVGILETKSDVVLAMFPDLDYHELSCQLKPGSKLIFFTDGVTEAFNMVGEPFGMDRFVKVVSKLPDGPAQDDVSEVVSAVNKYVGEADQFDDITCVVLHFNNSNESATSESKETKPLELTIKSEKSEIDRISGLIEDHGNACGWPQEWVFNTNLALDELITNIVSYGYDDDHPPADIHISLTDCENGIMIVLEDQSAQFDPFEEAPEPDIDAELDERRIGGLGVFLIKTLFSECRYERINNINRITLLKNKEE